MAGITEAECKIIAIGIVKETLREHVKTCPWHQAFLITKARIAGVIFGIVLASGVTSGTVFAIAMKMIGN